MFISRETLTAFISRFTYARIRINGTVIISRRPYAVKEKILPICPSLSRRDRVCQAQTDTTWPTICSRRSVHDICPRRCSQVAQAKLQTCYCKSCWHCRLRWQRLSASLVDIYDMWSIMTICACVNICCGRAWYTLTNAPLFTTMHHKAPHIHHHNNLHDKMRPFPPCHIYGHVYLSSPMTISQAITQHKPAKIIIVVCS